MKNNYEEEYQVHIDLFMFEVKKKEKIYIVMQIIYVLDE